MHLTENNYVAHMLQDVARNVLDHHDRVVHDEAGRDRQRHERQVVQAEAEQVHDREGPHERQRHREARDDVAGMFRRKTKMTSTTRTTASDELELDVPDRRADRHRPVGEDAHVDRRRERGLERGKQGIDVPRPP